MFGADPTANLPPKVAVGGVSGTGPRMPENYRARGLENVAGFCSPGRWRPGSRHLPSLEDVGAKLLEAMGVDTGSLSHDLTGNVITQNKEGK